VNVSGTAGLFVNTEMRLVATPSPSRSHRQKEQQFLKRSQVVRLPFMNLLPITLDADMIQYIFPFYKNNTVLLG